MRCRLEAVRVTSDYTVFKIEEIMTQFSEIRKHIEKHLPKMEYTVMDAIFTQPYIKAIHLVGEKIKSSNTARETDPDAMQFLA